jgi:hypothetical protein
MTAPPSATTDSDDIAAATFAAFGSWSAAVAARNRRARKPTLAAALRQAAKAGAKVSGAVLDPSGRVELRFGEQGTGDAKPDDLDQWIAKHHASHAKGH